ncbi:DUF2321 domain-containing protein [Roseburia hominis]|uniref:DUF2321 domain-containing protein n=1 Tax=Roseburia hominis TaxID=301301 RepID=UPI001C02F342|nr:DUF2321 domain-containing protein [Roseburia hominis]MBT9667757.1 hypothetical protein [Roseburia hominis]
MTENEAIERIKYRMHTVEQVAGKGGMEDLEMAIKALEEVQQYRALETRLAEMFGGALCLEIVIDELERQLKEPDNPHPINAKILTYEDAAAWDAYHAIGTPEECRAAVEKHQRAKNLIFDKSLMVLSCPTCGHYAQEVVDGDGSTRGNIPKYCSRCGQRLDWGTSDETG